MQNKLPIIVIGGGLYGLMAALELEKKSQKVLILEKTNALGGKIQTDLFEDTYLLDHGFQVLLPSYPMLKDLLPRLNLSPQYFYSGAKLFVGQSEFTVADPFKRPQDILSTALGSYGTLKDKLLVLKLKQFVESKSAEDILHLQYQTSLNFLKAFGFSAKMIDNFWLPFFSGVFLENELKTASNFLLFLYKMFGSSPVAVPKYGMGEVIAKMKEKLQQTQIQFLAEVASIDIDGVTLKNGQKILGSAVLGSSSKPSATWGVLTTYYYSAVKSPIQGPWLCLNSRANRGKINHIAVMTEVSKAYARNDQALISVNSISLETTENEIRSELQKIYGNDVKSWRFLKKYEIPKALPLYIEAESRVWDTPSQQGTLERAVRDVQSLSL
jgi:hypothetical protein